MHSMRLFPAIIALATILAGPAPALVTSVLPAGNHAAEVPEPVSGPSPPITAWLQLSASPVSYDRDVLVQPLTPFDLYVLADLDWGDEQGEHAITAWEAKVLLPLDEASWSVHEIELFPAGSLDIHAEELSFIVGLADGGLRQPDPGLPVKLARIRLEWVGENPERPYGWIRFGPTSPSSLPAAPRPAWVEDGEYLLDFDSLHEACINCPRATHSSSFGAWKGAARAN